MARLTLQARRTGAVVGTDKKISAGGNKAHAGKFIVEIIQALGIDDV